MPVLLPLLGRLRGGIKGGPFYGGMAPLPAVVFRISGVTRDSTGTALPSCTVSLFRTVDNAAIDQTISDAAGAYSFSGASASFTYYVVAYKAGSPDVAGTTVNTLVAAA